MPLESPVYTDADEDEGGEVKAEHPEEGHNAAHCISSPPGHRCRPSDLQWHHQERHLEHKNNEPTRAHGRIICISYIFFFGVCARRKCVS